MSLVKIDPGEDRVRDVRGNAIANARIITDYHDDDTTVNRSGALLQVVDYSSGEGDYIEVTGNNDSFNIQEDDTGTPFDATTSNAQTAQSIAAYIDGLPNFSAKYVPGYTWEPYVMIHYTNGYITQAQTYQSDGTTTGSSAWSFIQKNSTNKTIATVYDPDTDTLGDQPQYSDSNGYYSYYVDRKATVDFWFEHPSANFTEDHISDITLSGGANVTTPPSTKEHSIARWGGTGGGELQDSAPTIDNSGNINVQSNSINNVSIAQIKQLNNIRIVAPSIGEGFDTFAAAYADLPTGGGEIWIAETPTETQSTIVTKPLKLVGGGATFKDSGASSVSNDPINYIDLNGYTLTIDVGQCSIKGITTKNGAVTLGQSGGHYYNWDIELGNIGSPSHGIKVQGAIVNARLQLMSWVAGDTGIQFYGNSGNGDFINANEIYLYVANSNQNSSGSSAIECMGAGLATNTKQLKFKGNVITIQARSGVNEFNANYTDFAGNTWQGYGLENETVNFGSDCRFNGSVEHWQIRRPEISKVFSRLGSDFTWDSFTDPVPFNEYWNTGGEYDESAGERSFSPNFPGVYQVNLQLHVTDVTSGDGPYRVILFKSGSGFADTYQYAAGSELTISLDTLIQLEPWESIYVGVNDPSQAATVDSNDTTTYFKIKQVM